jgi:hypothetical protein
MGGIWTQWAFHPLILAFALLLGSLLFLLGSFLTDSSQMVRSVLLTVGAGSFRLCISHQWVVFTWEVRGVEGRPRGNTLQNTPKIYTILGHLSIQTISTLGILSVCTLVRARANAWNICPELGLAMSSVSYPTFLPRHADRLGCLDGLQYT